MKSNKFINATVIYILANGIGQGTTLLANIFFTRYMSQRDYGLYSNYYSIVAILVPFVGMNLYSGLSNAYIDYKKDINKVRSSVLLLSPIGLAVTSVFLALLKLTEHLSLPWICICLALIHSYSFFLINYYIQSMNMENKYIQKGIMLALPNLLQVLLSVVAILVCNTYINRAIGASFAIMLCGVIAAVIIIREEKPVVKLEYWSYVLKISLPAVISSVSSMIMQQCDKVMLTKIRGAEETAVYALVYNIGYILYAVLQATNGVWLVWLYKTMDCKEYTNINHVQKWYLTFMSFIGTMLFMIAPEIIKFLAPPSYWRFNYVIPFIIGSYFMVMYTTSTSVLSYMKKTGIISVIVSIAALVNIALNYILIPYWGGVGAAWTSVFSYLLIFVISTFYIKKNGSYFFGDLHYVKNVIYMMGLAIVFDLTKNTIIVRYTLFLLIICAQVFYYWKKRDEIIRILRR